MKVKTEIVWGLISLFLMIYAAFQHDVFWFIINFAFLCFNLIQLKRTKKNEEK